MIINNGLSVIGLGLNIGIFFVIGYVGEIGMLV